METIPYARTFIIYDLRNGGDPTRPHGVVEAKQRHGQIVHKGLKTTLFELRTMGRAEWKKLCPGPAYFIVSRETGMLSYHWKHAYTIADSGREKGAVTNPDTGCAIPRSEGGYLSRADFAEKKIFEQFWEEWDCDGFSAMWQADREKIQRMASLGYIATT